MWDTELKARSGMAAWIKLCHSIPATWCQPPKKSENTYVTVYLLQQHESYTSLIIWLKVGGVAWQRRNWDRDASETMPI